MLHRGLHVVLEELVYLVRLLELLLLTHGGHTVLIRRNIDKLSIVVGICGVVLLAITRILSIRLGSARPDQAGLVQPGDATDLFRVSIFAVETRRLIVPRLVKLIDFFYGFMV